jgi:hypothetical protein
LSLLPLQLFYGRTRQRTKCIGGFRGMRRTGISVVVQNSIKDGLAFRDGDVRVSTDRRAVIPEQKTVFLGLGEGSSGFGRGTAKRIKAGWPWARSFF